MIITNRHDPNPIHFEMLKPRNVLVEMTVDRIEGISILTAANKKLKLIQHAPKNLEDGGRPTLDLIPNDVGKPQKGLTETGAVGNA